MKTASIFTILFVGVAASTESDFAEYVEKHWLSLAPGQFCGITENRFSNLPQPGKYSLMVEHSSSAYPWLAARQTHERCAGIRQQVEICSRPRQVPEQ